MLLYVIESKGSSPGRQGFKMIVNEDGMMHGSIGGGFMEQKLVELAISKLKKNEPLKPFLKRQIHSKEAPSDQSGMICSGEQTVAFYPIDNNHLPALEAIMKSLSDGEPGVLKLNETGFEFTPNNTQKEEFQLYIADEEKWELKHQVGFNNIMYVIGGGHVGLALSVTMRQLGFYVVVIDDRDELNTMVKNHAAHKTLVVDYDNIENFITEGERSYVAIVSFGYRTDKQVLKRLVHKNYKYLGMMGSEEKVKTIMNELRQEGIRDNLLSKVHTPIGLPITSKTPEEIAISIAAQIIKIKNSKV